MSRVFLDTVGLVAYERGEATEAVAVVRSSPAGRDGGGLHFDPCHVSTRRSDIGDRRLDGFHQMFGLAVEINSRNARRRRNGSILEARIELIGLIVARLGGENQGEFMRQQQFPPAIIHSHAGSGRPRGEYRVREPQDFWA
jgi:hypothetical protein